MLLHTKWGGSGPSGSRASGRWSKLMARSGV